jgi:hypothetical protein
MSDPNIGCTRICELASPFLDGELAASTRRSVQGHLRGCAKCVGFYRRQQRFLRAVGAAGLDRDPAPDPGFADAVVETLALQRRETAQALGRRGEWWRNPSAWAAAAVVVAIGLAWGVGFHMGGGARPADDATRQPVADRVEEPARENPAREDPARENPVREAAVPREPGESERPGGLRPRQPGNRLAAFRTEGIEPEAFGRAVRGLIGDLAVLERVPDRQRRPLLAAQIRHFELADRAERALSLAAERGLAGREVDQFVELAAFARRVARAVEPGAEVDWSALFAEARENDLWSHAQVLGEPSVDVVLESPDRDRLGAVVAEVAAGLPAADRGELIELLALRDGWVRGQLDEVLLRRMTIDAAPSGSLALPLRVTTAWALSESGDESTARRVVEQMEVLWHGSSTSVSVSTSASASASAGDGQKGSGDPLPSAFDELMRRMRESARRQ